MKDLKSRNLPHYRKTAKSLDKVIRRACKRLGIHYRRVHGFRHFWITEMIRAGVPLPIVQQ